VTVTPDDAPVASVVFDGPTQHTCETPPWELELFHGTYWVRANAQGFVRAKPWPKVELTTAESVVVPLRKASINESTISDPIVSTFDRKTPVTLEITSDDALARIELVGDAGVIAAGLGRLTTNVWPGSYRLRTRADDGSLHERALGVDRSHQTRSIVVGRAAVPKAIEPLVHTTRPGAVFVSEALGALQAVDAISLIAAATTTAFHSNAGPGSELRKLVASGVVEHARPHGIVVASLDGVSATLDGAAPHRLGAAALATRWHSWQSPPGPRMLELHAGGRGWSVPIHVLPDRVTSIVVAMTAGLLEIVVLWIPDTAAFAVRDWRTAILAQRAFARGELSWAEALTAEHFRVPGSLAGDPTHALLRLALAIKRGDRDQILAAAKNVVTRDSRGAAALVDGSPVVEGPMLRVLAEHGPNRSRLVPHMTWAAYAAES
jgi:hypothetical protein